MTDWYVRSAAAGSNTGANWANAFTSLQNAVNAHGGGADRFFIADDHSETAATSGNLESNGNNAITAPYQQFCVNHSGSVPPVDADLATTGVFKTNSTISMNFSVNFGNYSYWRGMTLGVGNGGSGTVNFDMSNSADGRLLVFENCALQILSTGASSLFRTSGGANGRSQITLVNTTVQFGATGQKISLGNSPFLWKDTPSAIQGATIPTTLFNENSTGGGCTFEFDGVDFSAVTGTLVSAPGLANKYLFRNCKLNASVTICGRPTDQASRVYVIGSDSTGISARQEIHAMQGDLTTEKTIVLSSGASDGVTQISWKVITTSNSQFYWPMDTFEIAQWNSTTGSSKTATIEVITDNVTLTNADIFAEVQYLGSSSQPLVSRVSSAINSKLATASNLTTSSATWTTTGMGTPKPQKISVSFTPQMAGLVRITLFIAKASTTLYIDPKVTIT